MKRSAALQVLGVASCGMEGLGLDGLREGGHIVTLLGGALDGAVRTMAGCSPPTASLG